MALNMDLINKTAQGAVGNKYQLVQTTPKPLKVDMTKVQAAADAAIGSMNQPLKTPTLTPLKTAATGALDMQAFRYADAANTAKNDLQSQNLELRTLQDRASVLRTGVNAGAPAYGNELSGLQTKITGLTAKRDASQNALDSASANFYSAESKAKYSRVQSQPDFARYATVDKSYGKDAIYSYVNNIDNAQNKSQAQSFVSGTTNAYSIYGTMNDSERATYNYLYAKQGKKAANEYLDDLSLDLSSRNAERMQQRSSKAALRNPVLASGASVMTNLVGGIGYVDLAAQKIGNTLSGSNKPINFNSQAMAPSQNANAIRGTIAQNIQDNAKSEVGGKIGSFLYQTGMSMADSAVIAGLSFMGLPAASTLLGASAATNAAVEAKNRGATDEQALGYGLAAGVAESLFEKLSIDNLLKPSTAKSLAGVLKKALIQGGVEASEEVSTTIANTLADAIIMGDKSQYSLNVSQNIANGMSEQKAKEKAFVTWITGVAGDAIGGFISGGLMGGGTSALQYNASKAKPLVTPQIGTQTQQTQQAASPVKPVDLTPKIAQTVKPTSDTPTQPFAEINLQKPTATVATQNATQTSAQSVTAQPIPARQAAKTVDIQDRNFSNVGDRSVKAFQFEHPELHDHYSTAATYMQYDLDLTTKGERKGIKDADGYYVSGWGTKRKTNKYIAKLLDDANLTYDQIAKALDNIIQNHGQENYAAAKKVEVVLDEILSNGYQTLDGMSIPADADYISARDRITGTQTQSNSSADTEELPLANKERLQAVNAPSDTLTADVPRYGNDSVGAAAKKYKYQEKVSEFYSNTLQNTDMLTDEERANFKEEDFMVQSMSEKESTDIAQQRLSVDFEGEVADLGDPNAAYKDSTDTDTAMGIFEVYRNEGRESGNYSKMAQWARTVQKKATAAAKALQGLAKYSRTPAGAVIKAEQVIDDAEKAITERKNGAGQTVDTKRGKKIKDDIKQTTGKVADAIKQSASDVADDLDRSNGKAKDPIIGKKVIANDRGNIGTVIKHDIENNKYLLRFVSKDGATVEKWFDASEISLPDGRSVSALKEEATTSDDWAAQTGAALSEAISKRVEPATPKQKPITTTILNDLVRFAEEHALPTRKIITKRSAVDRIRDYFNNREFYGKAWNTAQDLIRKKYADNPEALDALDEWINSTIGYNSDAMSTDATMMNAILETAVTEDVSLKDIVDKAVIGDTQSTIDAVYAKLLNQVQPSQSDAMLLKDAVTRFVNGKVEAVNSDKRLSGIVRSALNDIKVTLTDAAKQSVSDKKAIAQKISDLLMSKYGVDADAATKVSETIYGKFNELVAERSKKILENMVKEAPKSKQKTLTQKVMEFINLGVYNESAVSDLVKEKYNLPTLDGNDIAKIYDLAEQASQQTDDYMKRVYESKIAQIITDKLPSNFGDKVRTIRRIAMLLNPKTLISRNAGGNAIFFFFEDLKDLPGTLIDMAVVRKTGERTTSLSTAKLKAQAQGFKKGAVEWAKDIKYGVNTSPTSHEMANTHTFKSKPGQVANFVDEVLNKVMQVGDRTFYQAAYDGRIAELDSLGYDTTTEDIAAEAREYALERVFQNDSKLAKKAIQLRDSMGLAGDITIPFAQTPANIFDKILDYSPVGIARSVKLWGKVGDSTFDQKKFVDTAARSLTGTGIFMLAIGMTAKGLLTGKRDKDKKKASADAAAGKQPYSIYVDGKSYTYDWASPIGALMAAAADAYIAYEKDEITKGNLLSAIEAGAKGYINAFFQQSYMDGLSDLFAYGDFAEGAINTFVNAPSQFVATFLSQTAKVVDPTVRETYDPNEFKSALNRIVAKIPWLSETLQPKINEKGEEVKQFQGRSTLSNALESYLSPGYYKTNEQTEADKELQRLYKSTKDASVYAPTPLKSVTLDNKPYILTGEEYTRFSKTQGQAAYKILDELIKSKEYKTLSDEAKLSVVQDVYSYAQSKAKDELLSSRKVKHETAAIVTELDGAVKNKITPTQFLTTKRLYTAPPATDTQTGAELQVKKLTPLLTPDLGKYVKETKTQESAADLARLNLLQRNDLTAQQKSYLDTALIGELKSPRDYTNEDKFILSTLTASQQKKYDTVQKRLGFTPRQYSVYLSAISKDKDAESWKQADKINALKAAGLSQSQAFMFIKIISE